MYTYLCVHYVFYSLMNKINLILEKLLILIFESVFVQTPNEQCQSNKIFKFILTVQSFLLFMTYFRKQN